MAKIEEIMEQLQTLTLLEAAELVEKIEETFGVDALGREAADKFNLPYEFVSSDCPL